MIGQYTLYYWSITIYTSLPLFICIVWRHFLIKHYDIFLYNPFSIFPFQI